MTAPARFTTRLCASLAVAAALLAAPSAHAADPPQQLAATGEAVQFVRALGDEVVDILKSGEASRKARTTKLRGVFNRAFDVDAMARFATGRFWREANTTQQLEYLRLFRDYVAELYANRFADYGGQSFEVIGERTLDDETIVVAGRIDQAQKPSTRVEFRVRKTSDGLKIVDVYADGLSLLITKRDEFTAVLAKNGMDGLIERLRQSRQG